MRSLSALARFYGSQGSSQNCIIIIIIIFIFWWRVIFWIITRHWKVRGSTFVTTKVLPLYFPSSKSKRYRPSPWSGELSTDPLVQNMLFQNIWWPGKAAVILDSWVISWWGMRYAILLPVPSGAMSRLKLVYWNVPNLTRYSLEIRLPGAEFKINVVCCADGIDHRISL